MVVQASLLVAVVMLLCLMAGADIVSAKLEKPFTVAKLRKGSPKQLRALLVREYGEEWCSDSLCQSSDRVSLIRRILELQRDIDGVPLEPELTAQAPEGGRAKSSSSAKKGGAKKKKSKGGKKKKGNGDDDGKKKEDSSTASAAKKAKPGADAKNKKAAANNKGAAAEDPKYEDIMKMFKKQEAEKADIRAKLKAAGFDIDRNVDFGEGFDVEAFKRGLEPREAPAVPTPEAEAEADEDHEHVEL